MESHSHLLHQSQGACTCRATLVKHEVSGKDRPSNEDAGCSLTFSLCQDCTRAADMELQHE